MPNPPYLALGHVLAVGGTTPATLWMANVNGDEKVFKSTDAGLTFTLTGTLPEKYDSSFYSIVVDPHDATHLITGFHEADKMAESTDGGETWKFTSGAGWPAGGVSWFPFFVETGNAATTRKTWFAIAQNGASAIMTSDGGATWTKPKGLEGLNHAHGCSQLYQTGRTLFIGGGGAPMGNGIYRSTDLGANWTRVTDGNVSVVWGTSEDGLRDVGLGLRELRPQRRRPAATRPRPSPATWAPGRRGHAAVGPGVGPEQRRRDVRRHALASSSARCGPRGSGATSSRSGSGRSMPRAAIQAEPPPTQRPSNSKSRGFAMNVAPAFVAASIVGGVGVGADHHGADTDARPQRNRLTKAAPLMPGRR